MGNEMEASSMTIKGVLFRFLLIYVALHLPAGLVIGLLGIRAGTITTSVNLGILFFSVVWVCMAFAKKNGRYFSSTERRAVVVGMIAIYFFPEVAAVWYKYNHASIGSLCLAMGYSVLTHAVVIIISINLAKKLLINKE
jgi:hypothetical protein